MYDGKQFKSFIITRGMLGLKVGEFVLTRKFGKLHKEKKISKKIKK
jgi:ribosomal protein S19